MSAVEPTDREVRARVSRIMRDLGIRCRRKRGRKSGFTAAQLQAMAREYADMMASQAAAEAAGELSPTGLVARLEP